MDKAVEGVEPISKFRGPYRFLSNFYSAKVTLCGETYPTVEHAFQAAKTLNCASRRMIRDCAAPGAAKRLGQCVKLRGDWEEVKVGIMTGLILQKFSEYGGLRKKLLATGDRMLIEENEWGDRFWGVCRGSGENHLGKILMKVRQELRRHNA